VFRDPDAGAGGQERCGGGDVEGRDRAAAGAAGVDQVFRIVDREWHHRGPQRLRHAGDLRRRLPFHAETDEQRGDLRGRSVAGHHRAKRGGDLGGGERFAGG
jgi:hypothetical protein